MMKTSPRTRNIAVKVSTRYWDRSIHTHCRSGGSSPRTAGVPACGAWSGRAAVNCRFTRSGARSAVGWAMVVRTFLVWVTPHRPLSRIRRSVVTGAIRLRAFRATAARPLDPQTLHTLDDNLAHRAA